MYHTQKIKTKKGVRKKNNRSLPQCLNCNKFGHFYRECKHPLNSYGVFIFRYNSKLNAIQYLMICRKHSFGYVECIRSCFDITNTNYIKQLLLEMTVQEREKIQHYSFNELWYDLWQHKNLRYNYEYKHSLYQFTKLRASSLFQNIYKQLPESVWTVPEWGFPKGKKNIGETSIHCAFREMQEETNLVHNKDILLLKKNHILPSNIVEMFRGTDGKFYRHTYFICKPTRCLEPCIDTTNKMQCREVSAIQWFTYTDCMKNIRSYNTAKINLIQKIHPKIVSYCKEIMNVSQLNYHHTIPNTNTCSNNCEESNDVLLT